MQLTQITGALACIGLVQAKHVKDNCKPNNLIRCFIATPSLAAPFCSSYIGDLAPTTTAVVQHTNFFTAVITKTNWVIQTNTETDFYTVTSTLPPPIFNNIVGNKVQPTPTALKCVKNKAAASISQACSCFESAVGGTHTAVVTSEVSTTTSATTFITETSTTTTTTDVAAATSVVPDPGPYCNQQADFIGTDPTTELAVVEGLDANGCALLCQATAGCVSYVLYEYFGLCGIFNVPVSELAGGTGPYTFWDKSCTIAPAHVPSCGVVSGPFDATTVPYNIDNPNTVSDQATCSALCAVNPGCLSYAIKSGVCVYFAAYVSQWADTTGTGTIGWDLNCAQDPIVPTCGVTAHPLPGVAYPGQFAEYCYQLCLASNPTCTSYSFDSGNFECTLYSETVAQLGVTLDTTGLVYYDASCPPSQYPTPACGVYASGNAASAAAFQMELTGLDILNCLANCLYNCASYSYYIDSNGVSHCDYYMSNLAQIVPPPDTTSTTIWYDSSCPAPAPPSQTP